MSYDCTWKVTKLEDPDINSSKNIAKKTEEGYLSLKTKSTFDFRPAIALDFWDDILTYSEEKV